MTFHLCNSAAVTFLRMVAVLVAARMLGGCAWTKISREPVPGADPEALALLTAAQRAHGAPSFATIRDLKVRYRGGWGMLGPRLQPVLSDRRYRRESEDALDLPSDTTAQLHNGPGGRKFVLRAPGRVTVWYNGQPDSREEVLRAAALNVDLEKMFLLGPLYFGRTGVTLEKLGTARVDGTECDQLLAVLQPGFGFADEDRVVLSIDRETQRLRRVRTTLNGLKQTENMEVDVTFRDWVQRSGVWWATDYTERLRGLFAPQLHHWKLEDLKANRGFAPNAPEFLGKAVSEAARRAQ